MWRRSQGHIIFVHLRNSEMIVLAIEYDEYQSSKNLLVTHICRSWRSDHGQWVSSDVVETKLYFGFCLKMPPSRPERFNAKARRSVVGGSSHKRKKNKKTLAAEPADTNANAEILEYKPLEEKEASRREVLRQEVRFQYLVTNTYWALPQLLLSTQGASSKKKKRMEKYIAWENLSLTVRFWLSFRISNCKRKKELSSCKNWRECESATSINIDWYQYIGHRKQKSHQVFIFSRLLL